MSTQPYQLDHVAIGVPDVTPVPEILVGALGGRPVGTGPGGGFQFWQWEFARGGRIEILEPDGPPDGFMHRFLTRHGAGIHHVTFKVPEIGAAMERAEKLGYEIIGFDDRFPGWKEAFLHPKQAQGIVVQLAESHPELEPEDDGTWTFPPAPPAAPHPADLRGLRLAAASADAARRQWQGALGGECQEREGGLAFRWPDSALEIRVCIDGSATPGPLGIEIAEGTTLPEHAERVLGTRFLPTTE